MFSLKRTGTVKCDYCGFVASSAHDLLTEHSCYRICSRNVVQQFPRIYRPSVIKRTKDLKSFRLPSTRQTSVRDNILKDVRNDSIAANLSKVHYGFRPPITSSQFIPSSSSSSWNEILDESEIPIPVFECMNRDEFFSKRNSGSRNNKSFTPKPVTVNRKFPPNYLERVSSPVPLYQLLLEESERPTTDHHFKRRISPVNHKSFPQLTSSFFDTEPLSMNTALGSEFMPESLTGLTGVMLVSPINKEITIVSLDDVINELEKRMEELPYEIRLRLEYEFLQNLQDVVNDEFKKTTNAV